MLPVYCKHFGLTREPFNITPDPSFLYLSESHREALAQLVYGVNARKGFVVLTGEVGTGKTTLIRCLLDELNGGTKTALVFNMIVSPDDLLRYVCEKFGLIANQEKRGDPHDYVTLLEGFLFDSYQSGHNVALIIDEAQNLTTELLENVRLLSNFETAKDKLFQILLVGQPELGTRLNAPELRQIKQRVALRYHLSPLNPSDSKEYMAKRLEAAGGSVSLFTTAAVDAVYNYSSGIPRLINILCDNGLLAAYALRKETVEAEMIGEVARDLQLVQLSRGVQIVKEATNSRPADSAGRRLEAENVRPSDSGDLDRQIKVNSHRLFDEFFPATEPLDPGFKANPNLVSPESKEPGSELFTASGSISDIVPPRVFDSMIRALTEAMGPMATLVLDEHVAAMGESMGAFPKKYLDRLVEITSLEILGETMKAKFQRRMAKEIHRLRNENNGQ